MLDAGGYWRPLAAVARLLEELGELAELLDGPGASGGELAGELADLWIITTALADQFLAAVPDPAGDLPGHRRPGASPVAGLVIAAGQIARVVNFYDGPKTPRPASELPTLKGAIGHFDVQLELLSGRLGLDLAKAVSDKLAGIRASGDMRRFAREASDPATAAVLEALPAELAGQRLWGAPADADAPVAELARAIVPSLTSFTKAAAAENLSAYVVGAPQTAGSGPLARWQRELMLELQLLDPRGMRDETSIGAGQLNFNGVALTAAILALGPRPPAAGGARALLVLAPGGGSVLAGPADDRS